MSEISEIRKILVMATTQKEAEQRLTALLHDRELAARIDELQDFHDWLYSSFNCVICKGEKLDEEFIHTELISRIKALESHSSKTPEFEGIKTEFETEEDRKAGIAALESQRHPSSENQNEPR